MMTKLLYKELTFDIIGAAMEVHGILGHGFLESVYQQALEHEFQIRGIEFVSQAELKVAYKNQNVGNFRADFLIDKKVIVEIKSIHKLTEVDEAQLMNYLKATGCRVGLLLNFGTPSLEYKRRIV